MTAHAQFPDEQSAEGAFVRQEDAFRDWVKAAPGAAHPVVPGAITSMSRWRARGRTARSSCASCSGLEDAVGMTVVDPVRDDLGWAFARVPGTRRPDQSLSLPERSVLARDPPIAAA